ncbi:hypothetical protein Dimus_025779 [Dionaea muscipula]
MATASLQVLPPLLQPQPPGSLWMEHVPLACALHPPTIPIPYTLALPPLPLIFCAPPLSLSLSLFCQLSPVIPPPDTTLSCLFRVLLSFLFLPSFLLRFLSEIV